MYAFLFTPPWQSNRVKKEKLHYLYDLQTSNIRHVYAKLYSELTFSVSIKARWGYRYLLENVKRSRVGCAEHARPGAAGAELQVSSAGDAVTHRGSSLPSPPQPHLRTDITTEAKDPSRNQSPALPEMDHLLQKTYSSYLIQLKFYWCTSGDFQKFILLFPEKMWTRVFPK